MPNSAALVAAAGGAAALIGLTVIMGVASDPAAAGGTGGIGAGAQLRPGTVPAQYAALVQAAGQVCPAAPAPIIAAQIKAESNWNPRAVSPVGAQGIAQFMPGTWRSFGKDENGDGRADPFDPADAIPAQARYDCAVAAQLAPDIASGRIRGDLTDLMLAAYNAGPGAVRKAGGIPQNGETPAYVSRIKQYAADFANPTIPTLGAVPSSEFGRRVVDTAMLYNNKLTYVWGGGNYFGPTGGGFDCSGLVLHAVYQASGGKIKLPHRADIQRTMGTPVPREQLQPGDAIAFAHPGASFFHHIGIYLGDGQMIHAPTFGKPVQITNLRTNYWGRMTWKAVRYG
ncbi:transglycosylase TgdA [Kineococcus sp. NUM-3379]